MSQNVDQRVGQLLMIGVAGKKLKVNEKSFIKKFQPAGVIYFRRNFETPAQLLRLTKSIQKLYPRKNPPFIGIDQEGGAVTRLGKPFTIFPGNIFLGKYYERTGKLNLLKKQVKAQCQELKSVGINFNFVPVADINSNLKNPIIGELGRSFSSSQTVVSKLSSEMIKAYRRKNVITCAKHFPGHGDTFSDSHKKLPRVRASKRKIMRREIPPFRSAISARVPTIMTAHVVYSALDPTIPATLSPQILTDLLRDRLKFRGVCISDDLEMAAIAGHGSIPEASLEAIRAGVDLLLVCKSLSIAQAVLKRLKLGLELRELPEARLRQAERRIAYLKERYLRQRFPLKSRTKMRHGWPKNRELAEEIEKKGKHKLLVSR